MLNDCYPDINNTNFMSEKMFLFLDLWGLMGDPFIIRRYLQHVLTKGFMRIRHYGFLANPIRKKRLAILLQLLLTLEGIKSRPKPEKPLVEPPEPQDCPKCMTGKMTRIIPIAPIKVKRRCWD